MGFLKWILPHLAIAFSVSVFIVTILDDFNPMMGFLTGAPFRVLVIAAMVCSVGTAVLYMFRPRKSKKRSRGKFEKVEKTEK